MPLAGARFWLSVQTHLHRFSNILFVKLKTATTKLSYTAAEVGKKYGVTGVPIAVLIDKEGKVIFSAPFIENEAKIEELINQNL